MLDDSDEFKPKSNAWVMVWSQDEYPKICFYPEHDYEVKGYKLVTPKEAHDGGFRLKEGTDPGDPINWAFDWRLRTS